MRRIWFGAGASSEYEYVFPYSLFRGPADPLIEIVREQLAIPERKPMISDDCMDAGLIQWKTVRAFLDAHHAGEDPLEALDALYELPRDIESRLVAKSAEAESRVAQGMEWPQRAAAFREALEIVRHA